MSALVAVPSLLACGDDGGPVASPPDAVEVGVDGKDDSEETSGPPPLGRVVLNEVQCRGEEWVEVINVGEAAIDLGGMRVNDGSSAVGVRLPARLLGVGERLVVRGSFGIACEREPAVLWQSSRELDRAPVRRGRPDIATWGRIPDGHGPFVETAPTPQKENLTHHDLRDRVFDPTRPMPVIDLFVDAGAEELLISEQKVYAPAFFRWSDADGSGPVQRVDVRIKGSITLRPWTAKPSLKLHFARHGEPGPRDLFGMRKLTLHNLAYDPSAAREWLAYELMRESGLPVPRVAWAVVRVNGVSKGLYAIIETYDEVFLADHFESSVALYEADGDFGENGELWGFELDEGDSLEPLLAFARRVGAAVRSPTPATRSLPEVDWSQLATLFGLEDLLQHTDGMKSGCHNWFLHLDGSGRWSFLPWSVDLTLIPTFGYEGPIGTCSKLAQLCERDEVCHARFLRARDDAARRVLTGAYRARMVELASRAQPFARPSDEPWTGNEFWPDLRFDLVAAAHLAVDQLERRASMIRCASAAQRGVVDAADPECGGFVQGPGGGKTSEARP